VLRFLSGGPSEAPLRRQVVRLALPAVGEQVLSLMVGIVNTMLVGHLSAEALTAVGLSSTITGMAHIFVSAVGTGTTALVAQAVGAEKPALATRTMEQAMMLAIALGFLVAVILIPLAPVTLALMGAEGATVDMGVTYLRLVAATLPLSVLMFVGNAALRGAGDTRSPMVVMSAVNLLNAALSYTLIRGTGPLPELGVTGAGIAAGVSTAAGGLAVMTTLLSGKAALRLRRPFNRPDRALLANLMRVGLPAGGESILMHGAFLAYARSISSLGTVAYAAYLIGQRIESLNSMPAQGFAIASTTLSGQSFGAGDPARARRSVFASIRLALGLAAVCSALSLGIPHVLLSLFTDDAAVITQGIPVVRVVAFAQPLMSLAFCLAGGLRGAGDTRSVMTITGISAWCVRVPLAVLSVTVFNLGLVGVQTSMMLDWLSRCIMLGWRFRPVAWEQRAAKLSRELVTATVDQVP
jgi:MATE family multidrug resistance protein